MTYIPASLRARVAARAQESCEYCLVYADYAAFKHEIDHVIAVKHGGATEADNLAYACAQCNRFKGSNIAALDPLTGDRRCPVVQSASAAVARALSVGRSGDCAPIGVWSCD